jgi:hypothetical protein
MVAGVSGIHTEVLCPDDPFLGGQWSVTFRFVGAISAQLMTRSGMNGNAWIEQSQR